MTTDTRVTLGDYLGNNLEEDFLSFDLTEIQEVLASLAEDSAIDIAHAEILQQKCLRGADILIEYLSKITQSLGYLEARENKIRNTISLNYDGGGAKTSIELRKMAGEASEEVEALAIKISRAKASKVVLDKKLDLILKSYYHWKGIAEGLRRTVLGYHPVDKEPVPEGY